MASLSTCPLCERDKYMKSPKTLYGHSVCKKCVYSFANRRQMAWIIDMLLIRFTLIGVGYGIGVVLVARMLEAHGEILESDMQTLGAIDWGLFFVVLFVVLVKDGFAGRSIGKLCTGVKVISDLTGEPIDFFASMKRNWPTLIPFMPLVCAFQMAKGSRAGDGFANTRVIWVRHENNPVFKIHSMENDMDSAVPKFAGSESENPFRAPNL